MKKLLIVLLLSGTLLSCSATTTPQQYPKSPSQMRDERTGSLAGKDGVVLFGKGDKAFLNRYTASKPESQLFQAALETVSFMPLNSVDSNSGFIITDWYESEATKGERFKLNISVNQAKKQVHVKAYKQIKVKDSWQDAALGTELAREFEQQIIHSAGSKKHD
jgi:hypothetical protein